MTRFLKNWKNTDYSISGPSLSRLTLPLPSEWQLWCMSDESCDVALLLSLTGSDDAFESFKWASFGIFVVGVCCCFCGFRFRASLVPLSNSSIPPINALVGSFPSAFAAMTSAFNSSMSRFNFARRFWNHVITWALLRPSDWAISSRSTGVRYFWYRNRFSSSYICLFVKAVRDFRRFFELCDFDNPFAIVWSSLSFSENKRHSNFFKIN